MATARRPSPSAGCPASSRRRGLRRFARQGLYLPDAELRRELGNLAPILSKVIDWHLLERQYDERVKFTAVLHHRTAGAGRSCAASRARQLPLPLLGLRGVPPRDPRRSERGRMMEQRRRLRILRRERLQPDEGPGDRGGGAAPAAELPGLCKQTNVVVSPVGTRLGSADDARGLACADATALRLHSIRTSTVGAI